MYENLIRCEASRQKGLSSIPSCKISSILIYGEFWKKTGWQFTELGLNTLQLLFGVNMKLQELYTTSFIQLIVYALIAVPKT